MNLGRLGGFFAGTSALRFAALLTAGLAALAVLIFVDLPGHARFMKELQDSGHAPAFAFVALVLLGLMQGIPKRWMRYACAGLLALILGAAVEVVQHFIGRDAELKDVFHDGLGIAMALAAVGLLGPRRGTGHRRSSIALAAVVVVSVCLWLAPLARCGLAYARRDAAFPVLLQAPFDLYFVRPTIPSIGKVRVSPTGDAAPPEDLLAVPYTEPPWPGLVIDDPAPDWSMYETLAIDIANPADSAEGVVVVVHDDDYDGRREDRFQRDYLLPPHSRRVLRVPLTEVAQGPRGRRLDLERIWRLAVAHDLDDRRHEFLVARIWLE